MFSHTLYRIGTFGGYLWVLKHTYWGCLVYYMSTTNYISKQILCPLNKHNLPTASTSNLKKKIEKIDTTRNTLNMEKVINKQKSGYHLIKKKQLNFEEVASVRRNKVNWKITCFFNLFTVLSISLLFIISHPRQNFPSHFLDE